MKWWCKRQIGSGEEYQPQEISVLHRKLMDRRDGDADGREHALPSVPASATSSGHWDDARDARDVRSNNAAVAAAAAAIISRVQHPKSPNQEPSEQVKVTINTILILKYLGKGLCLLRLSRSLTRQKLPCSNRL